MEKSLKIPAGFRQILFICSGIIIDDVAKFLSNLRLNFKEATLTLLEVGSKAPDFNTVDQHGKSVSLNDFLGQKVVIYFYPKDDTPGCTKEACAFRDLYNDYKDHNIAVLGVSIDSEKSHKKFAEKYQLPFTLLVDNEKKIVEAYGVWGEKSLYGKKYMGTNRVTYLIDESGNIAAVFPKVKPAEHAAEILKMVTK